MAVYSQTEDVTGSVDKQPVSPVSWGVIYNSVGTMRAEPRYAAEMVSQALLGTPVHILEQNGGWRHVQTPDGYTGWMNGSVQPMTDVEMLQYRSLPKIIVTALYSRSFSETDVSSQAVSDLVAGDMLVLKGEKNGFFHAVYPDGREAYVPETDAQTVSNWLQTNDLSGEGIMQTAKKMAGVPYLWGGTSTKGLDCSGFTKTVYFLHGLVLKRDASQQVQHGKLVDEAGCFADAEVGDLVFFGEKATPENLAERVVHVGIYIGGKRFIHASDYVRISSFDPQDPLYDDYNTNRYLRTKRVLGEVDGVGIETVFENEFYSPSTQSGQKDLLNFKTN